MFRGERVTWGYQALSCRRKSNNVDYLVYEYSKVGCRVVCEGVLPLVITVHRVVPLVVLLVRPFWIDESYPVPLFFLHHQP